MKNSKKTNCKHPGETPFMTTEKRYCAACKKIYYYDNAPIDFKAVANGKNGGGQKV